jgi:transcriptional regulator with XRE-family HTH domain
MIQGHRLRHIREQRGLSQRKLGRLIGKDGQYLWKLESGMRSCVTSTTLARLAVALGTSSDFLLGLDDRPARAPGTRRARHPAPVLYPVVPEGLTDGVPMSVEVQTDVPGSFDMCPHCAVPMQPMADERGIACRACRYTVEWGL